MTRKDAVLRILVYGSLAVATLFIIVHRREVSRHAPVAEKAASRQPQDLYTGYPYPFREAVTKQYYLLALRYLSDKGGYVQLFGPRDQLSVQRLKSEEVAEPDTIVLTHGNRTLCRLTPADEGRVKILDDLDQAWSGIQKLLDGPVPKTSPGEPDSAQSSPVKYDPMALILEINAVDQRLLDSFQMQDLLHLARLTALEGYYLKYTYSQSAWFYGTGIAASDLASRIWKKPECLETLAFCLALAGRESDAANILERLPEDRGERTVWRTYAKALVTYDDRLVQEDSTFLGRFLRAELEAHDYKIDWAIETYKSLVKDEPFFWPGYIRICHMGAVSDQHIATLAGLVAVLNNGAMWNYFGLEEAPASRDLEILFNQFAETKRLLNHGKNETALLPPPVAFGIMNSCLEESVSERIRFLGWMYASPDASRDFLLQSESYLNQLDIGDMIRGIDDEPLGRDVGNKVLIERLEPILTTWKRLDLAYRTLNSYDRDSATRFVLQRKNRLDDVADDHLWIARCAWENRKFWPVSIAEAKRAAELAPYNHRAYYNLKSTDYTQPWDQRGLEKLPYSYAMHVNAGDYYYGSVVPRYRQAQSLYEKAIEIYPYDEMPYEKLTAIHLHYGELLQAQSVLLSYLQYDSKSLSAVSMKCTLAGTYLEQGKLEDAYPLYQQAAQSGKAEGLLGLAHVNERFGNIDRAETYYKEARDRYRNSCTEDLGYFQLRHHETGAKVLLEGVIRKKQEAYKRSPARFEFLSKIAGIYAVLRDFEKSASFLEKALQGGEHDSFVKLMAGVVAFEKGSLEKSRQIFSSTVPSGSYKDDYKELLKVLNGTMSAEDLLAGVPHDSSGTNIYLILSYYFLLQNQQERAVECLKQCVRSPYPDLVSWNLAYRKLEALHEIDPDLWTRQKIIDRADRKPHHAA